MNERKEEGGRTARGAAQAFDLVKKFHHPLIRSIEDIRGLRDGERKGICCISSCSYYLF